ncbi:MAG TPA: amidohydrolase family protein [Hanamia sp.]|nr:amidohydrolase family protein [Hanamia sp.]
MKKALALFLLLSFVGNDLLFSQTNKSIAFTHVTVIDVKTGNLQPDMTVVVNGNRIIVVEKTTKVPIPENAQIINAPGKFLIPGLWDMHVHSLYEGRPELFFPMFIANGVTGVREMGSSMPFEKINAIRKQIENGELLGPRFGAVTGKILDDTAWGPEIEAVTTPDEARKAVRAHKSGGADFIKVYDGLSRPVYFAIVDEAKKLNLPFEGHLPRSICAKEASDAGQKSMEHLIGIMEACSSKEDEIRQVKNSAAIGEQILNSFDDTKAANLFRLFAANQTYQCPTLTFTRTFFDADFDKGLADDPRLVYIPSENREKWKKEISQMPDSIPWGKAFFLKLMAIVNEMNQLHVPLLAGTDAGLGNPYTFAGFSLHAELASLVQAGLTPLEALQTATINPARFLNKENELGTIEKGKVADLVLLDANPLEDIHNTTQINAVVANGSYFSRADLDSLLEEAKIKAAQR